MDKMGELKLEISKNLLKASKSGCDEECNPDRPEKEILEYCKANFNEMSRLGECVKQESFCTLCCESEFGELHLEERSNCYNKCNDYYINKVKFKTKKKVFLNVDITPTSTSKRIESNEENSAENSKGSNASNNGRNNNRYNKERVGIKRIDDTMDKEQKKVTMKKERSSLKKELLKLIKKDLNDLHDDSEDSETDAISDD